MRKRKYNIFDEINDLYVDIYLIGYESEGESCIFVLKSNTEIFYTIVIDSYETDKNNYIIKILDSIDKERKLDMLVWTHPHDDHSIGLDKIISKKCDKDTKIIISNILNKELEYSKTSNSIIKYISSKLNGKSPKGRWNINSMAHFSDLLQEINFTHGKNLIKTMKIRCIAPYPTIGPVQGLLKEEKINKLSIGILVEILNEENVLNFLFTGDMEKQTIDSICIEQEDEEIPYVYNYIKIPHHGSNNPVNLTNLLSEDVKSEIGCTTVFCSKKLPEDKAIKSYNKFIENISCTSDINNNKFGDGIIKVSYDIKNKISKTYYYGTANKVII